MLAFADINILQEDIAEVIIHEGVEITKLMVDEYHQHLITILKAPFSLLINKKHAYTYEFSAQESLGSIPEINAVAIVVHSEISKIASYSIINFPRKKPWQAEIFTNREDGLVWLRLQQSVSIANNNKVFYN